MCVTCTCQTSQTNRVVFDASAVALGVTSDQGLMCSSSNPPSCNIPNIIPSGSRPRCVRCSNTEFNVAATAVTVGDGCLPCQYHTVALPAAQ